MHWHWWFATTSVAFRSCHFNSCASACEYQKQAQIWAQIIESFEGNRCTPYQPSIISVALDKIPWKSRVHTVFWFYRPKATIATVSIGVFDLTVQSLVSIIDVYFKVIRTSITAICSYSKCIPEISCCWSMFWLFLNHPWNKLSYFQYDRPEPRSRAWRGA